MKPSEHELEQILRDAPRMKAPAGLKQRLLQDMPTTAQARSEEPVLRPASGAGWLRRWWPALASAGVSVACAAVFTVQQREIDTLKRELENPKPPATETSVTNELQRKTQVQPTLSASDQAEIERLTKRAEELHAEISQLEKLGSENAQIRAQLAVPAFEGLSTEETEALAKAKQRAESIQCINNLKQFGLAVRVWSLDNGEQSPPDVLSMSNELSATSVVICPSDSGRKAAANWSVFSPANCSYEYLAPTAPETEPQRILSRCPIHGHIGLIDGSVQSSIAKNHPEWLVTRDGKLYFEVPAEKTVQPAKANAPGFQ